MSLIGGAHERKLNWTFRTLNKRLPADNRGKQLLMKMGWTDGKGLGVNEDGIKEHIKPKNERNFRGVGHTENDEKWSQHGENFTNLLAALSDGVATESAPKKPTNSLEEKSQKSRARVHYHKFTRGKDLSRYSEKDLANIFGKTTLQHVAKQEPVEEVEEVGTVQRGSMVDYFKKKLNGRKYTVASSDKYEVGRNGVLKTIKSEKDEPQAAGFGFGFVSDEAKNVASSGSDAAPNSGALGFGFTGDQTKSSAASDLNNAPVTQSDADVANVKAMDRGSMVNYFKRKFMENFSAPQKTASIDDEQINKRRDSSDGEPRSGFGFGFHSKTTKSGFVSHLNEEPQPEAAAAPRIVKKKKRKQPYDGGEATDVKKKKANDSDQGTVNPAYNPNSRQAFVQVKHVLTTIAEENGDGNEEPSVPVVLDRKIIKAKRNKSLVTSDVVFEDDNGAFNNPNIAMDDSIGDVMPNGDLYEVKRKKKKTKTIDAEECGYSNPAIDLDVSNGTNGMSCEANEVKRKNKTDKSKLVVEDGYTNPAVDLDDAGPDGDATNGLYEVKRKKKKSKNVNDDYTDVSDGKKNNKKAKATVANGLDNPALNLSCRSDEGVAINDVPSVDDTKRKKKLKKQRQDIGLDNPALNLSYDAEPNSTEIDNSALEVSASNIRSKKKKSRQTEHGLDNPAMNLSAESAVEDGLAAEASSPKKKNKKTNRSATERCGLDNPAMNLSADDDANRTKPVAADVEDSHRKELFEINDRIIENNGLENPGFDLITNVVSEGANHLSDAFDIVQSILENDMNERKYRKTTDRFTLNDETDESSDESERRKEKFKVDVPDGINSRHGCVLKYNRPLRPSYYRSKSICSAKKHYTHLIKHDVVVGFKGTNLQAIEGYRDTTLTDL